MFLKEWEETEAARIQPLTDEALVAEIASVMNDRRYSWLTMRLHEVGIFHFAMHRRWNILCDPKRQ